MPTTEPNKPAGAQSFLTDELAAMKRDAERYRYLRDIAHPDSDFGVWVAKERTNSWGKPFSAHKSGNALDIAIDEAMADNEPGKGRA